MSEEEGKTIKECVDDAEMFFASCGAKRQGIIYRKKDKHNTADRVIRAARWAIEHGYDE